MAPGLHGSARTTPRVRAELPRSHEATRSLAARYGLNPKTVAEWRWRESIGAPALPAPDQDPQAVARSRVHRQAARHREALDEPAGAWRRALGRRELGRGVDRPDPSSRPHPAKPADKGGP